MKRKFRPKYLLIKEKLKKQILNGEYPPGARLPSQNELMKSEQASYSTILRVLSELKNENLINRIGGKGTFVQENPGKGAEKLKIRIALLETADIESELKTEGDFAFPKVELIHDIVRYCTLNNLEAEPVYYSDNDFIDSRIYDSNSGVIFLSTSNKKSLFGKLNASEIPYVAHAPMDCVYDNYNAVTVNVKHGAYMATMALIEAGHENIALFYTHFGRDYWAAPKLMGYKEALREAGIGFREELVLRSSGVTQEHIKASEKFFDSGAGKKVTALFAINDRRAMAAMEVMEARGIRIPDDIAVIGCDDLPQARDFKIPLTTIKYPCREICEAAVQVLLLLEQNPKLAPLVKIVNTELAYRASFPRG